LCSYKASQSNNLARHMKTHTALSVNSGLKIT
jgi:hypothetical protein